MDWTGGLVAVGWVACLTVPTFIAYLWHELRERRNERDFHINHRVDKYTRK